DYMSHSQHFLAVSREYEFEREQGGISMSFLKGQGLSLYNILSRPQTMHYASNLVTRFNCLFYEIGILKIVFKKKISSCANFTTQGSSQANATINVLAKESTSGAIIHVSGLPKNQARQTLIIINNVHNFEQYISPSFQIIQLLQEHELTHLQFIGDLLSASGYRDISTTQPDKDPYAVSNEV
ncbi:hypothetical protein STEG23_024894, partial [Scotinomys teguina]